MARMKNSKNEYQVVVTEHYTKCYTVEAYSEEEAEELAQELAEDDDDLTSPHNFDSRDVECTEAE